MNFDSAYEDIRPYRDHEFRMVMDRLLSSELANLLIATVFPTAPVEDVKNQLRNINTIKDFQEKVIYKAMHLILSRTCTGLSKSGLENLNQGQNYLFISNHRDIIFDPSLINTVIVEQGFETAEIAIGDNLLEKPWVKDLARLNKSFIVKRNLPVRELITASKHLSGYIKATLLNKGESVWIAQREGRAKDGNDRTHAGVLNMLGLSAEKSLREHFASLNILPVSLSYELDPCDVDKVRSLYAQKMFGGYTKEPNEDNLAMRKGIMGHKGNIHIHFGKPIHQQILDLPNHLHKSELIHHIGQLIDAQIVGNYKIQKSNQIAFDILADNSERSGCSYESADKAQFLSSLEEKINAMAGDPHDLRNIFLQMYAKPLQNKQAMSGV
jgi:1-acyl-sn-glycerol-3-phosphate acyltransferase